jgi:hypothetical protein
MTEDEPYELSALLRAVRLARTEVDLARHGKPPRGVASAVVEQRELLVALEEYEEALISHGNPTPYRMRDELALYRGIFSVRHRQ